MTFVFEPAAYDVLLRCLAEAQGVGAVGKPALDRQIAQAMGYIADVPTTTVMSVVDLGSGGGIPALPLILRYPQSTWVLVEAWERRAAMLRRFCRLLGVSDRVQVDSSRAEEFGRSAYRHSADLVIARGFGPAAVALECAAPLLRVGGRVVLSVRATDAFWAADSLKELGLSAGVDWRVEEFSYRSAECLSATPDRYPRRVGIPERSPLF